MGLVKLSVEMGGIGQTVYKSGQNWFIPLLEQVGLVECSLSEDGIGHILQELVRFLQFSA